MEVTPFCLIFSEKAFLPLRKNLVPVVLGPTEVHEILPPHSFIDVFDFSSPKELAKYLLHLNSSDSEYLEYFNWKRKYQVETQLPTYKVVFCMFCEFLQINRKPSTVENYTQWLMDKSECNNDKTLEYL